MSENVGKQKMLQVSKIKLTIEEKYIYVNSYDLTKTLCASY